MIDQKEETKKLYKDAVYYHLLHKGYNYKRAEIESEKIFNIL